MRKKECILVLFSFLQFVAFSQNLSHKQILQRDSLTAKLKADSIHIFRFQKVRPYLNIDQRNSFIKDAPINVYGLQLGVLLHEKHVVGLGGYTITELTKQKVKTKTNKNIDANRNLEMKYLTFFYQYVAVDKRFFEVDLQAEFGGGVFNIKLYDAKTNILIFNRSSGMLVMGLGPQVTIKPFRWIGFNAMAGYRLTFEKNTNLNFNGAYYAFGVWLDIRQIIRDCNFYLIKKPKYKKHMHQLCENTN